MTTIIVVGDVDDCEIEGYIKSELAKSYQVTYIKENVIEKSGEGYELLVLDLPVLEGVSLPECIIMMKANGIPPMVSYPERSIIIANSENPRQLAALKSLNNSVISCGNQKWDTISYSSYTSDSIMLSLNREITAFSGTQIEPLEIPLEFSKEPHNIYNLLSFTALRLLLDNFNSEIGELY